MTLAELRQKHPRFIYESYQAELVAEGLQLTFHFKLEPDIEFHPIQTLKGVTAEQWHTMPEEVRQLWVFHIGLALIPSYWKAAAPQEILIKAGFLTEAQLKWWQTLLIKGMGEFFYVNDIDFTVPDFLSIVVDPSQTAQPTQPWSFTPTSEYLIPVGGGKDSALTLCLFDEHQLDYGVFVLNGIQSAFNISNAAHPKQLLTASRVIDPKLLELNENGYLNGHVPFSAHLAFVSRLVGLLFGYRSVVISNEGSSNEGNLEFHAHIINHQYSKSYEFELGFENYLHQHNLMPPDPVMPAYFSLVRPLYELQISRLLINCSTFEQYASLFRSCNKGHATNSWCGDCPKCLFTFVSFYPFLAEEKLVDIFGSNLFEKANLIDDARALLGVTNAKPFDCVGTKEENAAAFYLSCKKNTDQDRPLPLILQQVWDEVLSKQTNLDQRAQAILSSWNPEHQVPATLAEILKHALNTT
jgi:UDP-N-acetyl-alpha-D-muramoyl-L-alanyl-L-glutamate epimerase